jgi:hypothetical protein
MHHLWLEDPFPFFRTRAIEKSRLQCMLFPLGRRRISAAQIRAALRLPFPCDRDGSARGEVYGHY